MSCEASRGAVDLVCFCHLRWNFVFQRPQHLLSRWSRTRRVFFFEEPVWFAETEDHGDQLHLDHSDSSGVVVATPHLRSGRAAEEDRAVLRRMVSQLLQEQRISANAIAWYYTPMAVDFTDHLSFGLTVYDCMDELSAFRGAPARLKELEYRLLGRADLVFTGGQSLYEAKRHSHGNVHAFPSAVDVSHFAKARTMQADPADQGAIARPRLGFFGVLDERLDFDLIAAVAARRPDWQIVLIGPMAKIDPASLPRAPNLHFLGQKDYAELPAYLAGWDVALLPFARNEATRFISPTKTPEYLAGGRPVVSTSIRDVVRPYGDMGLVHIADAPQDFEQAIERALAEDASVRQARVDEFLAERTWDVTWRRMADLVEQTMDQKSRQGRRATLPGLPPSFDALVVGAGYAGSVMAERLAATGKRVLLVDRRDHLAGNAYDHRDQAGILVHRYGPHIFHTNSPDVFAYLSRFTDWRPYEHRVLAEVDGKLLPIPINLDTVNRLYGWDLDGPGLEEFFRRVAEPRATIKTSEDVIVSKVGQELYEKFFKFYTRKQWGLDPSQLDASVIARIPVRTDHDDRYFTDKFQFMPMDGYTAMFERMVDHPNITIELGVDYRELLGKVRFDKLIYSGPVDRFFDTCFGKLPYRSLDFRFETHDQERFQSAPVVNYPNQHDYTRITEFKYLNGQESPRTTVVYEVPQGDGDPYYPVPQPQNAALYARYQAMAEAMANVHFVGRLATYKYYNMDQVTAQALSLAAKLTGVTRTHLLARPSESRRQPKPASVRIELTEPAAARMGAASPPASSIEIWGGLECTLNRVGDRYFDQLHRSGHRERPEDLHRFASLGICALRYPVLWESVAPDGLASADWRFSDRSLATVRELGMRPIVGLLHHGSGPASTSLLHDNFAEGLAEYARACAERYSWVQDWTPINEPTTTARFSTLYRHWYPHLCDEAAFATAVVNQCRGIALAMRAIRSVIPGARLVQTDDLGTTHATPPMQYQADFENERHWLSLDLLCGKVGPGTVAWDILRRGVSEDALEFFLAEPCPPDIVGVNYYVTSDRFLDHRRELYPAWTWAENGRDRYADIPAARILDAPPPDHLEPLVKAAERYHLPCAITECHLDSTREEQMRWLLQGFQAAEKARQAGHDVRALTVWALNGLFDWNKLVTTEDGYYEAGAFDLRASTPRRTALAWLTRTLASGPSSALQHPVLGLPGWWQRPGRVIHGAQQESPPTPPASPRAILICGTGRLGQAFARTCEVRGLPFRLAGPADFDITAPAHIETLLDECRPWALINTWGTVGVDEAELSQEAAVREYTQAPVTLAEACRERGVRLLTFSTDLVFDGEQRRPYVESDQVAPLNVFGRSKWAAEEKVLALDPSALVVRTATLFSPWDELNLVVGILRAWQQRKCVRMLGDRVISPTYVPDLVRSCLDFLVDGEHGLWHLANRGAVTPAELAGRIAQMARIQPTIEECKSCDLCLPAPRPPFSALASERGWPMPSLEQSVERFLFDIADSDIGRSVGLEP